MLQAAAATTAAPAATRVDFTHVAAGMGLHGSRTQVRRLSAPAAVLCALALWAVLLQFSSRSESSASVELVMSGAS